VVCCVVVWCVVLCGVLCCVGVVGVVLGVLLLCVVLCGGVVLCGVVVVGMLVWWDWGLCGLRVACCVLRVLVECSWCCVVLCVYWLCWCGVVCGVPGTQRKGFLFARDQGGMRYTPPLALSYNLNKIVV
jgi:hypothetical protein